MQVSENGIKIIKQSESLELSAYLDPVKIPTIGYGTTRYPDGRKVKLGDRITINEAEAFLKFQLDVLCRCFDEHMKDVALNQNQFDALVSFAYNVGFGACMGSTLVSKLKDGDYKGAAKEFIHWDKGTIDGVKQTLSGLTRRRELERELFERTGDFGKPIPACSSAEEAVVKALGFRRESKNFIVTYDIKGQVVETLELEDNAPETFIKAVGLYPNLKSFSLAEPTENFPDSSHTLFSGLIQSSSSSQDAPKLERQLLARGSVDDELHPGNDVRELQQRLMDLGYYMGLVDGVFGSLTHAAVVDFQAEYFGKCEADGKVGPKTWAALWENCYVSPPENCMSKKGENYLRLTKTNRKYPNGNVVLILSYYRNGLFAGSIDVVSGQGHRQSFRKGCESKTKSMEPLPEGKWSLGCIEWANGKDNYCGCVFNDGLGPAKIRLEYQEPGETERSAIEIHIDWNCPSKQGTAGCIGIRNVADFKILVKWLRETDPKYLYVDWNLGTCPLHAENQIRTL